MGSRGVPSVCEQVAVLYLPSLIVHHAGRCIVSSSKCVRAFPPSPRLRTSGVPSACAGRSLPPQIVHQRCAKCVGQRYDMIVAER